jgi:orotate phosphoribosyltransferase
MPAAERDPRDRLIALLAQRSARRGQFTLASGKQSTLYIDARLTTMHPDGLTIIGPLALAALGASSWGREVTAVGGLTLGADPISYAISYASGLAVAARRADRSRGKKTSGSSGTETKAGDAPEQPLRAFTVRKEAKQHGTGKLIEGPFVPGDRVAIIEDVITTGGSALKAVEAVRAAGGVVMGVLALVDREEGGREAIEAAQAEGDTGGGAGVPVLALVGAAEIVARME